MSTWNLSRFDIKYIQAHRDYANIWGEKMFCAFNAINLFKFLILQSNDSLIERVVFKLADKFMYLYY